MTRSISISVSHCDEIWTLTTGSCVVYIFKCTTVVSRPAPIVSGLYVRVSLLPFLSFEQDGELMIHTQTQTRASSSPRVFQKGRSFKRTEIDPPIRSHTENSPKRDPSKKRKRAQEKANGRKDAHTPSEEVRCEKRSGRGKSVNFRTSWLSHGSVESQKNRTIFFSIL